MWKPAALLVLACISLSAFSESIVYECKLLDERGNKESIKASIYNSNEAIVTKCVEDSPCSGVPWCEGGVCKETIFPTAIVLESRGIMGRYEYEKTTVIYRDSMKAYSRYVERYPSGYEDAWRLDGVCSLQ